MPTQYSSATKKRAAIALLTSGTAKGAARVCRLPYSTVKHWKSHDAEFQGFYAEFKSEFAEKLSATFAKTIDLAGEAVIDRLIHGDKIFHPKSGELVQRPVTARDAALIGAIATDKLLTLSGQPTQIIEHKGNPDELAEMLKQLSDQVRAKSHRVIEAQNIKSLPAKKDLDPP